MDVFDLRQRVIGQYANYVGSFVTIGDSRIRDHVDVEMRSGVLWPQPLVQLNPAFEPGDDLEALVRAGTLHPKCLEIFRDKPTPREDRGLLRLHRHQVEGIRAARAGHSYVLTTGTGSGKSLSYIVPIVDHVLRNGPGRGIQAIIVYPMNALANSQKGELEKYLCHGFAEPPVTFRRYTGQEKDEERRSIIENPPDILLTNYVMLELVLTRPNERRLVEAARGLRFIVFDELHTYRGRQGSDVAMLIRRVREAAAAPDLLHVGTSATLSGNSTWRGQQEEVAQIAAKLFGAKVDADDVIGETLRRVTHGPPPTAAELRARVVAGSLPGDAAAFCADPLTRWVETTLGLAPEPGSGRLVRSKPRSLSGVDGAAHLLALETGLEDGVCADAIRDTLLAGYRHKDAHGRPVFAFRLHQFISKGERVYASPERESDRYITLHGQQYVPGSDRSKVLLPVAFCRECGQEYYVVERVHHRGGADYFQPRELSERPDDEDADGGYLFIDTVDPWPSDEEAQLDRLPESWVETRANGTRRVVKNREVRLPERVPVRPDGVEGPDGVEAWFVPAPFLFCMRCKVEYDAYQRSDYGKLATLGTEGRSSATTLLALTNIRRLRADGTLEPKARKLLSFTDNRQDASLQAGHFNDFVEVVLLRGALRKAVAAAGAAGLRHDSLIPRVFEALGLPVEVYALNPTVKFAAREEADRALRKVLEYYVYRDLKRGWRVSSPNLEQCGLLDIDYLSLRDLCEDEPSWHECHEALRTATPMQREHVCRVLLDYLRRELAIRVPVLEQQEQESIIQLSHQNLNEAWALDESEVFERSRVAWPRGKQSFDNAWDRGVFLSPRGGFGMFLRRPATFPDAPSRLNRDGSEKVIQHLFEVLCNIGGLLHEAHPARDGGVPGYQLKAGMMVWRPADGSRAFRDPVRVPNAPPDGLRTNPFFVGFYRSDIDDMRQLEGREHTAQVAAEVREDREERFRSARLPILFCSPTMELGVDISQLNVVNMRNVPPTPANYAQRSGRAGRSGQPAFVYTYCSAYSPHDQYFFKRPERMVGGSVSTPRLDLANEDLLRAHVHAIWLSCARLDLHSSLAQILDVDGDPPSLEPRGPIRDALANPVARQAARQRARFALGQAVHALLDGQGSVDEWLTRVLNELPASFDRACERWRSLYRAAHATSKRQGAIVIDASRTSADRERARRLRAEAEAQLKLLLAAESRDHQSDFYSYRYFASEGFLPGYNFPRLPLSAWIPGRRRRTGKDEYLQRPRFLAIAEFGPRGIVYHEGSRFVIHKAMLPVEGEDADFTRAAKQCTECGYLHPISDARDPDCCERCQVLLPPALDNLFPMRNVVAKRRDRINSDEEERMRLGYELRTGVRYAERLGQVDRHSARLLTADGEVLAELEYGHAATLWRVNLGWRRRGDDAPLGYLIDEETGVWSKSQAVEPQAAGAGPTDGDEGGSSRKRRVVPYVEDRRNCLLLRVEGAGDPAVIASVQSAIKVAIQSWFQLEDSELAAEPLPSDDDRRLILLYEAAEGGAGVLRRVVDDPKVVPQLAREALARCHFDPDTGADLLRGPMSKEDCEAACYDCLLSYYNQRDHRILDRKRIRNILLAWRDGRVESSPRPLTREEHVERLLRLCQSELEKRWLRFIAEGGWALPSDAQYRFDGLRVQVDFYYRDQQVIVFVDGPHHDRPEQAEKDRAQVEALLDAGFPMVLRFHHAADWRIMVRQFASVFGVGWEEQS